MASSELPKDPVILLSYINTMLRDHYNSLTALCEDREWSKEFICSTLAALDYHYSEEHNKFL
ncbi:MAG: DUF4250 domain-containing protein [Lachnospiraceae bacterium]|nr:DUF4250 domain-containing protein [Lachnospiraceae bacterium]